MSAKISSLPLLTSITGNEDVPVVIGGANYKMKTSSLKGATTKEEVGLANVDNTADAVKPVSGPVAQALAGKANTNHTHAIDTIAGLPDALLGKSNTGHQHLLTDVQGLTDALLGKANSSHGHAIEAIAGLVGELENKSPIGHSHNKSSINGLVDDLTSLQSQINQKSPSGHGHNPSEITGLNERILQVVTDAGIGDTTNSVEVGMLAW